MRHDRQKFILGLVGFLKLVALSPELRKQIGIADGDAEVISDGVDQLNVRGRESARLLIEQVHHAQSLTAHF